MMQTKKWESKYSQDHPLVGKVWDVSAKKYISLSSLASEIDSAKYKVLGEKHDNPDHHILRAQLIGETSSKEDKLVVAFEHITYDQTSDLETHLSLNPWSARGLGRALNWQKQGWPDFNIFFPLFQQVLDQRLIIKPLSPSRKFLSQIRSKGFEAFDDNDYRDLELDKKLPQRLRLPLIEELRAAHCYQISKTAATKMLKIQRAKDSFMALRAERMSKKQEGIYLIVGNGHARKEWGIPYYLKKVDKKADIVSVGFFEVQDDYTDPSVYIENTDAFDYIVFTPKVDRVDPCDKFKKSALPKLLKDKKR